jgi:hypothetical protein
MSETTIRSDGHTIDFRKDLFREYVRTNRFAAFEGKGPTNCISQKLSSDPIIRHPLVTRLTGAGVTGSTMLRGSGEAIGNYWWTTNPTFYRHAVEFNKEDSQKTNLDLMRESRPLLLQWMMEEHRDRIINAFGSVYNGTTYASLDVTTQSPVAATEGNKDTWLQNNWDRVIFGDTEYSPTATVGDHSAGLTTVDSTNSLFTYSRLRDMRRLAEDADPHIRPYQTQEEGEVYVVFAGSVAFRDFKASLDTINQNADIRGMKITSGGNVIGRDGDMFFEGTIVRKVPEIGTLLSGTGKSLALAGASATTRVEAVFMCGQQAMVHGLGQMPDVIVDRDYDFKFRPAVAVECKEDVKKTFFNDIQHGMVTGYFSGVA